MLNLKIDQFYASRNTFKIEKEDWDLFQFMGSFFQFHYPFPFTFHPRFQKKKKTECNHNLTFGKDVYVGFLFFPCIVGVTRCNGLKKWKCNNRELKY